MDKSIRESVVQLRTQVAAGRRTSALSIIAAIEAALDSSASKRAPKKSAPKKDAGSDNADD